MFVWNTTGCMCHEECRVGNGFRTAASGERTGTRGTWIATTLGTSVLYSMLFLVHILHIH